MRYNTVCVVEASQRYGLSAANAATLYLVFELLVAY